MDWLQNCIYVVMIQRTSLAQSFAFNKSFWWFCDCIKELHRHNKVNFFWNCILISGTTVINIAAFEFLFPQKAITTRLIQFRLYKIVDVQIQFHNIYGPIVLHKALFVDENSFRWRKRRVFRLGTTIVNVCYESFFLSLLLYSPGCRTK